MGMQYMYGIVYMGTGVFVDSKGRLLCGNGGGITSAYYERQNSTGISMHDIDPLG